MTSIRISRPQSGPTARRRGAVALAVVAVATATLASTAPAYAAGKGGGRAIKASAQCGSPTGLLKFKGKPDTGGVLEVGGEVDVNVNGQAWAVTVVDNGVTVWKGTRTTAAPSGAFGAGARIPNLAGADVVTFIATHGTTVCKASVTI